MPDFFPFAGIRYRRDPDPARGDDLTARVAPPYDVIDEDQRRDLEAAHPENAVRLILPRDGDVDGDRYERAAGAYSTWCDDGVLERDPDPRFYGYRMDFTDEHGRARHTLGVLGALALPETAGSGTVLPHERTLPKAKSDRLALLRATRLNLDPIWGLSLTDGLTAAIDTSTPLGECTDEHGTLHSLFAIDDAGAQRAIHDGVAATALVLADGHHRFETAIAYRDECRTRGVDDPGADAIMCFVVELADDQLDIEPIHRLLHLPAGSSPSSSTLRDLLGGAFTVTAAGPNSPAGVDALETAMAGAGGLGLVDSEGLALLTPRTEVTAPALVHEPAPVAHTDSALVEAVVVPLLAGASIEYRHDARAVAALVASGVADAALLLRPVSVADTRAAAVAGARMPQKTTFFFPKPRTGMVFRTLD